MPPLRSVMSCSPSARARTVTAHSLKAIGIKKAKEKLRERLDKRPCRLLASCEAVEWRSPLKIRNLSGNPKSPANKLFFWGKSLQSPVGEALGGLDDGGVIAVAPAEGGGGQVAGLDGR